MEAPAEPLQEWSPESVKSFWEICRKTKLSQWNLRNQNLFQLCGKRLLTEIIKKKFDEHGARWKLTSHPFPVYTINIFPLLPSQDWHLHNKSQKSHDCYQEACLSCSSVAIDGFVLHLKNALCWVEAISWKRSGLEQKQLNDACWLLYVDRFQVSSLRVTKVLYI